MEVKLSQKTFKALANPTRIAILKELDKRNFTQSELSENLGFAIPTIKQHLQDLEKAGLINILEEGRKWKYVELTKDGKAILHPEEKKIWILLGTLGASIVGGIITATKKVVSPMTQKIAPLAEKVPELAEGAVKGVKTFAEETVATTAADSMQVVKDTAGSEIVTRAGGPVVQEVVNQAVQAPVAPIMTHPPLAPETAAQAIQQTPIIVYVFIAIAILSALGILFFLIKRKKQMKWLKKFGGKSK